jgi:hypothetical protein
MNNEELETKLKFDLAQFSDKFSINRYFLGMEYIYIERDEVQHGGEESFEADYLFGLNMMMKNKLVAINAITFGLGGKFINTKIAQGSVSAIPLGLYVNFALPINSLPISLTTEVYYSPRPLTFSNGDEYFEHRYELSFEVIQMGELFVGYRDVEITPNSDGIDINKANISETGYVGIRFGF